MDKKFVTLMFAALFLVSCLLLPEAQAYGDKKGKMCHKGMDGKIYSKACLIMQNQEELGLSDEKVAQVKALKYEVKKEIVQMDADIKLAKINIKEKMHEDVVDLKILNNLIDKKYELKKAKAKYLAGKYVALKGMLSDEQNKELKELCRASYKR